MITEKKVYRLMKGQQLEWYVNPRPHYDDPGTRVIIYAHEYLSEDDPRLEQKTIEQYMELVGQIPNSTSIKACTFDELVQAIDELQSFIKRCGHPTGWIKETLDDFVAESARVESERKAQEKAAARAEEIADRKAIREALEKIRIAPATIVPLANNPDRKFEDLEQVAMEDVPPRFWVDGKLNGTLSSANFALNREDWELDGKAISHHTFTERIKVKREGDKSIVYPFSELCELEIKVRARRTKFIEEQEAK